MNSLQEIRQAMADYQSGKMGHLSRVRAKSCPTLTVL
jgi:hypothetical protein